MDYQMFRILSEPNRFDILELLYSKPRSVNEIVNSMHIHQPQVSKHLKVLANAGFVEVRQDKNKHIYTLKSDRFKELDKWLEKYRELWEQRFGRLDILLKNAERKEVKRGVR